VLAYAARRLVYTVWVILAMMFLVVLVIHAVPGDPVQIMLGDQLTRELYDAMRAELGLDDPIHVQYLNYVAGVMRGDFGISSRTRSPVAIELFAVIPWTLALAAGAIVVSVVIGVPAGILAGVRRNTAVDRIIMSLAVAGASAPYFWTGMLLLYAFAYRLHWFPAFGASDGLRSLVLPSLTLGLNYASMLARLARSTILDVISQDYIRTARAKAVPERSVLYKHALRNASLPLLTVLGLQLGMVLSGALIVEVVFAWPGIGRMVITAVQSRDIPSIQAAVLFMGVFVSLVNLIVDLLYSVLDPRVRYA
jgi:peptide/nickel transport system permease protein